jgi:hypothetical protein
MSLAGSEIHFLINLARCDQLRVPPEYHRENGVSRRVESSEEF